MNKKHMIFITSEGEFLRGIPIVPNPEIGDEVEFQLKASFPTLKYKMKPFIIGPTLVAAVLLIFFATALFPTSNSAYAYVQLGNDIELGVDENGTVISVKRLSEDNKVLTIDELEGLTLKEALTKATKDIKINNEEVSITTKYNDDQPSQAKENIEKTVKEVKNKKPSKSNQVKQNIEKHLNNNSKQQQQNPNKKQNINNSSNSSKGQPNNDKKQTENSHISPSQKNKPNVKENLKETPKAKNSNETKQTPNSHTNKENGNTNKNANGNSSKNSNAKNGSQNVKDK
nr:anti-sigma factor domain-containing protein [Lysinibacillus timonensis]